MGWIDTELALTALAAMLSPTTLIFSVLVLVLGDRPLRTGFFFYVGAFTATLGIGVVAAFVLGNAAASSTPSSPKTWVAIVDVVIGLFLLVWVARRLRRPRVSGLTSASRQMLSAPPRLGLAALLVGGALGFTAAASASLGDQRALAERYAPVVRLVEQKHERGPGEPTGGWTSTRCSVSRRSPTAARPKPKTGVRHWLPSTAECN